MRGLALATSLGMALFAVTPLPHTSNYSLNSYGFGSGGTANSHTTTYSLEGQTGELNGSRTNPAATGSNYATNPGFIETQQANVPKLSALDNNSNIYYNKLHFVIDQQGNPTDAKYLLEIDTSSAFTAPQYVQSDGTLSATLNTADYQTYAAWGGSSGSVIVGLLSSTQYYVRLRATQGKFTESAFGPSLNATTAAQSITFSLITSTQSVPPFSVDFGTLTNYGTVYTAPQTISTTVTTNGASGGDVYITGKNGGLKSSNTGNLISAVSNDLSTLSDGFGVQSSSAGQTSGGPFTAVSPYNGTTTNVGIVNSVARSLYTSLNPVIGGSGTLILEAKSAKTDVAASDYQEVLTFVAAANF